MIIIYVTKSRIVSDIEKDVYKEATEIDIYLFFFSSEDKQILEYFLLSSFHCVYQDISLIIFRNKNMTLFLTCSFIDKKMRQG